MQAETFPGPLAHVIETTGATRTALGMPGVSWAEEARELETLMRRIRRSPST
jgi:hypothetical protein